MNELLMTTWVTYPSPPVTPLLAQSDVIESTGDFFSSMWSSFGSFLPSLIYAIVILIIGWIVATIAASIVKGLLKKTDIDNKLAQWVTGQSQEAPSPPIEKWVAAAVYWLILIFTLVAFLQALRLDVVSEPLNNFLQQIFSYLPRVGGAALLLAGAWVVATIAKLLFTNVLSRFNLDDKLAGATEGEAAEGSPFLVNETLGNALYWFILLFFLPLVLDVLQLRGPLEPVQNLLDDILSALPRILTATIIGVLGWLIARIVRGIATNLLSATGVDSLGERFGLGRDAQAASLSSIIGTVVYVLILIPTAIAALNALQIEAISAPAVDMLELILLMIPRIFAAIVILGVFYFIGQFVSELVSSLLTSVGFNNIFRWLGLPQLQEQIPTEPTQPTPASQEPVDEPSPYVRPTPENQLAAQARTPSEIVGLIVLVAIVLVGAVAATEVLQFEQLTTIVQAVLRISLRVLSGVIIFGVGLYFANLAFNLISTGSKQMNILAQTARIAIIAFVAALSLQQMGIAPDIVNLAFGLLLGSIAVAIAIAFGLGGRDIASEQIREWLSSFKSQP